MHQYMQLLLKVLQEKFGFIVVVDDQNDFAISDYIYHSIGFIQFIVELENELNIELPDDFLVFEMLESAKGFSEKLDYYMDSLRYRSDCNSIV